MNRETINKKKLKQLIYAVIIFFGNPFIWMWELNLLPEQNYFIVRYLGSLIIECGILIVFCVIMLAYHVTIRDFLYSDSSENG